MFWVVQENLYNEQGQRDLLRTLNRLSIPHIEVKFLPFLRKLVDNQLDINTIEDVENLPEPNFPTGDGLVMVCGAIALARVATERGWVPGSFINENFHTSMWQKHLGDHLLNAGSRIITLKEFGRMLRHTPPETHLTAKFIRPCNDDKAFTGLVVEAGQLKFWCNQLLAEALNTGRFTSDLELAISEPQELHGEFRFFVVDGRVVTGSRYRLGNQVLYSEEIPPHILKFSQQMVDLWQPARAFVIDIAETPMGPRVIEINNFNSAGFYASNVGKIVEAIEGMVF